MTTNELLVELLTILPNAELGEDNDGQLIVYTGVVSSDDWSQELISLEGSS